MMTTYNKIIRNRVKVSNTIYLRYSTKISIPYVAETVDNPGQSSIHIAGLERDYTAVDFNRLLLSKRYCYRLLCLVRARV